MHSCLCHDMSLKISWLSCQRNLPNSTPFSCIVERTLEYTREEKRQQQWLLSVCTTQMQPPNPDLKDTSAPVVASLLVQTDVNFGVDMLTGTRVESTELCPYWARKLFFDNPELSSESEAVFCDQADKLGLPSPQCFCETNHLLLEATHLHPFQAHCKSSDLT